MVTSRIVVSACALVASQLAGQLAAAQATDVVCNQCVNSADIANGTVKSEDLSTNAVETAKIKNNSITYNKLSPGMKAQLDGAVADITFFRVFESAVGFVGAGCPEGRHAVSASCGCDDDSGTTNFGVLNLCASVGDGAIAACSLDASTFDPLLGDPIALVEAVCMGVTANDGTPWVPVPDGLAPFDANSPDAAQSVELQAKWRKEQHDAFEAAMAEQRARYADYKNRVRSR